MEETVAAEKDILISRAHEYDRVVKETDSESVASKGNRVKLRKQNNFFLCRDHYTNPSAVFGVFNESKETLKDLQIATLEILSIASKGKYTKEDILSRISFVVSDSTAHNLGVIEAVCEELKVDKVPDTLLCNVHPLMMFDRKIRELCQQIHDGIGGHKLSKCFLVDVDFRNESFPIKAIKCLSNFVCKDFSAKPWNYSIWNYSIWNYSIWNYSILVNLSVLKKTSRFP